MKYITVLSIFFLFLGLSSCEKNLIEANQQWQFADPNSANFKIVNAYTSNIPAGAPGVGVTRFYIYQDLEKLNGNALASPGSWPGPNTYASLKTGTTSLNLILDRRVGNDYGKPVKGDTAFSAKITMDAGKFYTAFMLGDAPNQSIWTVEDKIVVPKENYYAARFANLVTSAVAKPVDIYSRREKRKIATNLTYKVMTEFVELPISTVADTLDVMDAGTSKVLYFTTLSPLSRRVYTFYTYGKTGFAAERLTSYTNR